MSRPCLIRSALALAPMLATMLATACEPAPTQFSGGNGTYVLRTIAGLALPQRVRGDDFEYEEVIADTILIRGDGTGRRVTVDGAFRMELGEGDELVLVGPEVTSDAQEFTYMSFGSQILISLPCVSEHLTCIPFPDVTGALAGNDLVLDRDRDRATPAQYERISND